MAVYLDHAATTPMLPEAIDAYTRALGTFGNPSSIHSAGQEAKRLLEESRETVATSVGADPIEVVFTSGGTEAINAAIKGLHWARNVGESRPLILAPGGEHHATIDAVEWLVNRQQAEVHWLPLDDDGFVLLDALERELVDNGDRVSLLTSIWVNNEVGSIQPIERMSALAARFGVPFHVDAVAAYGHVPIDLAAVRAASGSTGGAGLVALSVSAHKIGGPVGAGALVLSRRATIEALVHGGGQQRQVRSGTQDVAAAAAFAAAARSAVERMSSEGPRLAVLRDRLVDGVRAAVPDAVLNGPTGEARVATNAHFSFPGCEGDSLLFLLDMAGVAVSTGSACQAGIPEPSHVLRAMGRDEDASRGALRMTLGHGSTDSDVDALLAALPSAYAQARKAGRADRAVVPR